MLCDVVVVCLFVVFVIVVDFGMVCVIFVEVGWFDVQIFDMCVL